MSRVSDKRWKLFGTRAQDVGDADPGGSAVETCNGEGRCRRQSKENAEARSLLKIEDAGFLKTKATRRDFKILMPYGDQT